MSTPSNTVSNFSNDSSSHFLELLRFCEQSQLIYCGVDSTNRGNGGYTLLFSSSSVAQEAADVLHGDWDGDGSNAVTVCQYKVVSIHQEDSIVVEYAEESVKFELKERDIEYCQQGEYCYINKLSMRAKTKARSGKPIVLTEKVMQVLEGLWELGLLEFPTQSVDLE